jgi:hypothetical protein
LKKKNFLVIISFIAIWITLTILAVTWGVRIDWPDNVHIDYGFPFTWSTQTLSTIIGPVNLWRVDVGVLVVDLVFWLGILLIITSILAYFSRSHA